MPYITVKYVVEFITEILMLINLQQFRSSDWAT